MPPQRQIGVGKRKDERPHGAEAEARQPAAGKRRCIGSERFGIEAHDAPIEDFPAQPSQKDGLGRMCKTHWNQYTAGLARDAKAKLGGATSQTGRAGGPPRSRPSTRLG